MKIEVFHKEGSEFVHVANVNVSLENMYDALDYAFRWTNNIDGSWSKKSDLNVKGFDGNVYPNTDLNSDVEVVAPLKEVNGTVWGHRSSSVGDKFVIDGVVHYVDSFGFRPEDI